MRDVYRVQEKSSFSLHKHGVAAKEHSLERNRWLVDVDRGRERSTKTSYIKHPADRDKQTGSLLMTLMGM